MRHLTCPLRLGPGPVLAAMVATVVLPAGAQEPPKPLLRSPSAYEELQTFSAVLSQIRANYVDSVAYHELVHAAIDGMLHVLDPHSHFMSRAEWEQQSAFMRGELPGVGGQLGGEDGTATVLAVDP